jgi:hypothetical protein
MHPKRPMIFLGRGGGNLGVPNGSVLFNWFLTCSQKVPNGVPQSCSQ